MASVTTWRRLEPRCRTEDFRGALQAAVHDPLWLLARQWQLGEFRGSDGGSPVMARFRAEQLLPNRVVLGPASRETTAAAAAFDAAAAPLETLVEREPVRTPPHSTARVAAEAGLHFLRLLEHHGGATARRAFIEAYPLEVSAAALHEASPQTRAFLTLLAARVPDGDKLSAVVQQARPSAAAGAWTFPAALALSADESAAAGRAADAWLRWSGQVFSEPAEASAWNAERMEYGFSLGARGSDGNVTLEARGYAGGRLDWYHFDRTSNDTGATASPAQIVRVAMPTPVTFRGMPAARYWEFEDGQVDFGDVLAEPEDLGRLLLVEFALTYGNDWFLMPVELPIGSLCHRRSLVVIDTFGQQTLIRSSADVDRADSPWRMFHVAPDVFFLAPALVSGLEAAPVEEVLFARDETANLVWAIERIVESPAGGGSPRVETTTSASDATSDSAAPAVPSYRVMTPVPRNWIPFVPRIDGGAMRLRRAAAAQPDGSPPPEPAGRILGPMLSVPEEEVPRGGIRVTRAYQFARSSDGAAHLWVGRRKRPGGGEQSSGLRYDVVSND
jgi:hypothetical protein